jgi:hypothetical protein
MLIRYIIFLVTLLFLPACFEKSSYAPSESLYASPAKVAVYNTAKTAPTKKYVNGVPVTGYGEISKVTGRPRTKIVSGYWRHTSKGLTWVNPYARS